MSLESVPTKNSSVPLRPHSGLTPLPLRDLPAQATVVDRLDVQLRSGRIRWNRRLPTGRLGRNARMTHRPVSGGAPRPAPCHRASIARGPGSCRGPAGERAARGHRARYRSAFQSPQSSRAIVTAAVENAAIEVRRARSVGCVEQCGPVPRPYRRALIGRENARAPTSPGNDRTPRCLLCPALDR